MRSDDIQANNLFSRLISYTPREGRTALEDFCTESLAWCLRWPPEFQRKFLELVKSKLSKRQLFFRSDTDGITMEVETQFGFSRDEEKGRFDLKISNPADGFALVVEVKVDSNFGDKQIDTYRKQLKGEREFLISLTKRPVELEKDLDAVLRWAEVQNLLEQTGAQPNSMLKQFADFLKEQGMFLMKINRIVPGGLKDWKDSFALQRDLWEILDHLSKAEEIKPFFLLEKKEKPKKIIFEFSQDRTRLWLGIYGNGKPLDWFGFEISNFSTSPELCMMVSFKFGGLVPEEKLRGQLGSTLKRTDEKFGSGRETSRNITWFNFRQPIDDEYNGNADKIYHWLLSAIQEQLKFQL